MEQLRIKRKDIYEIEVNDKGETICFPMGDISLAFRLNEAYEGIDKVQNWLKSKLLIIDKQTDSPVKGSVMTKNEIDRTKAFDKAYKDMRISMDKFLGEGGCHKIFGDENYLEMYNDLFDELNKKDENGQSHLDKMKITSESISERIKAKYGIDEEQVI